MIPQAIDTQMDGAAMCCDLISSDLPQDVFWDLTASVEHELPGFALQIVVNRFQLH